MPDRAEGVRGATGATQSVETDWRELVERKDIDLIDIASPNDTHAEIAIAAAQGRQDGDVREAARPERPPKRSRWSTAVEAAGVPNMVWYNYRRVPAVTLIKQLIDEGKLGRIFHYRAKFLQDWTISQDLPQGGEGLWRLDVGGRRQRRHRRSARALHRHGAVAERADRRSHGDDRNVHQGAQAQPDRQGRAGRHRRRQRVSVPVRERIAGDVRSDALRARPQGALHARDQRRARVGALGPARSASPAVCSIIATKGSCAAGGASTSPTATIRT